jgi:hypothetical protein
MPSSVTLDRRLAQEQARHPGLAKSPLKLARDVDRANQAKFPLIFAGEKNG